MEVNVTRYAHQIIAYIVPGLRYDVVLGKLWIEREDVVYVARKHLLTIGRAGNIEVWEKGYEPVTKKPTGISALAVEAFLRRARHTRSPQKTLIVAVTLADIDKALAPKPLQEDIRLPPELTP